MKSLLTRWQLKRLADTEPVPWRNGGGITHELAVWPDAKDWQWRISVAEVAKAGPFSRFEDVDRQFAVLSGAGVRLVFAGSTVELTPQDAPFAFSGEEACDCQLLSGPTLDFNLMSKGRKASLVRFTHAPFDGVAQVGDTVGCYAIEPVQVRMGDETLEVPAHTLCWCMPCDSMPFHIAGNAWLGWNLRPDSNR